MSDASAKRREFSPTDDQRRVLLDLEELRTKRLGESMDLFGARIGFGGSTWSRIVKCLSPGEAARGNYFELVSKPEAYWPAIVERLRLLRRELADREAEKHEPLVMTEMITTLLATVQLAQGQPRLEERRIVIVLADRGGGKTRALRYLKRPPVNAKAVETRPAWERSYFTALRDTGAAMGINFEPGLGTAAMETLIVDTATIGGVLCFDEGEFLGKHSLDLIKLLANKTGAVPVLFMRPKAWDDLLKHHCAEAEQVQRRASFVRFTKVDPIGEVQRFAELRQIELTEGAANLIANAANKSALLSTVDDVLKQLQFSGVEQAQVDDADKAVAKVFGLQNRPYAPLPEKKEVAK